MDQKAIRLILEDHMEWLASERKEGKKANLVNANLESLDLSGTYLQYAELVGANLKGADLSGANLSNTNLYWSNLSGADLTRANFSGANLEKVDLSYVLIRDTNFYRARLCDVNFRKTIFTGKPIFLKANFSDSVFLETEMDVNPDVFKDTFNFDLSILDPEYSDYLDQNPVRSHNVSPYHSYII